MKRTAATLLTLLALLATVRAETFSGNLLVRPDWTHKKIGATTASEAFSALYNVTHTSGTSTNQMDQLWVSRRVLAATTEETIDLAGGITNSFGTVLTVARVKMIAVAPVSTNAGPLHVGGAASDTFDTWVGDATDKVEVRAGGFLLIVAPDATGYGVSTNGNLSVSNTAATASTYDIYIGGASQ